MSKNPRAGNSRDDEIRSNVILFELDIIFVPILVPHDSNNVLPFSRILIISTQFPFGSGPC